ncbi:MAG: hypothetical protein IPM53_28655 [Anaerolineaceae bacterium]|nr:hypothetical protein [Anaerolineaceae bacterium]
MINFLVIAVLGAAIGYFWGRIYHNRYGLGHLLNALIGLVGALLGSFAAMWLTGSTITPAAPLAWGVWLAAGAGAFLLVAVAQFLRGRQYE